MSTGSGGNVRVSEHETGASLGRRGDTPPDPPSGKAPPGQRQRDALLDGRNVEGNTNAARNQRSQQGPSGVSTQLNIIPASPITRRSRRKSTFEPRVTADALISPTVPSFTSPLAQLFSPIVSEPPNGGFNGPPGNQQGTLGTTHLGLRRAARRSANESQMAPGVAMFRRRAMSNMLGPSGLGTSALSTTPREEPSQEPSGTVGEMEEDEESEVPVQTKMAVMEQKLQRIEDMLQQLMDRLDG
ncbi:hypothetical protein FRC08_009873 [Ceratobasidium sp. 394]|nr:hypothetical protein FRC08_009873 [Ceratobasidium sp. 394]